MTAFTFPLLIILSVLFTSTWGLDKRGNSRGLNGLHGMLGGPSVRDVMVNNGSRGDNYFDSKNMNDFGVLKNVLRDSKEMKKFNKLAQLVGSNVSDNEATDLVTKYFWGKTNGIIMEIGAIDGTTSSQSKPLEDTIGWHRILVEGSPLHAKALTENSRNAFAFTCAICDTPGEVHYINEGGAVGGIAELMAPAFLNHFHKDVAALDRSKWTTLPHVQKVACFPLQKLLAATHVHQVNAFIVDVEGGELAILNSIKWSEVLFDVIVVETNPSMRPPGYERQVTAFLAHKGYQWVENKGRNSWYKHITFVPSAMPH